MTTTITIDHGFSYEFISLSGNKAAWAFSDEVAEGLCTPLSVFLRDMDVDLETLDRHAHTGDPIWFIDIDEPFTVTKSVYEPPEQERDPDVHDDEFWLSEAGIRRSEEIMAAHRKSLEDAM